MANAEQLEILKSGVEKWNEWLGKIEDEEFQIDLSGADLSGANLEGADLSGANLEGADLSGVVLYGVQLSGANLTGVKLTKDHLILADLSNTILSNVDLSDFELWGTNLTRAELTNTNFSRCELNDTVFALTDLSTCKGLETTIVMGPCIIDIQTLRASKNLPKSFLLKIGLPELFIDYLPDFFADSYLFPAFLSHSWKNKPFVRNLYESLIGKGVNVFLDEKKMKPGDDIYESISKGIQDYDKMILVCSNESLTESWWVDRELDRVLAKERELFKKHGKRINLLIPITLDDYIFEWKGAKAEEVRRYIIGDFRPEADFEKSLNDLVHALHVERPDVKPPSNY